MLLNLHLQIRKLKTQKKYKYCQEKTSKLIEVFSDSGFRENDNFKRNLKTLS